MSFLRGIIIFSKLHVSLQAVSLIKTSNLFNYTFKKLAASFDSLYTFERKRVLSCLRKRKAQFQFFSFGSANKISFT